MKSSPSQPVSFESVTPRVSCLCVTHFKPHMLERAIACFKEQTYPNKQLVVVYEEADSLTCKFMAALPASSEIKPVQIPAAASKVVLGQLRNVSVREADGEFVCQWDDDDWYDPERIAAQIDCLRQAEKEACVLSRWIVYDDCRNKAYLSHRRLWEGSILCRRQVMLDHPYDSLEKGEDTSVINYLRGSNSLAVMEDMPELYVYTFHGTNTWESSHFDEIFRAGSELPEEYVSQIKKLLSV